MDEKPRNLVGNRGEKLKDQSDEKPPNPMED